MRKRLCKISQDEQELLLRGYIAIFQVKRLRYFPTLREEQQAISDAMKLRNVHGVFQKLEYIYVPLMLSASTTADELSQAITARGIDNPRPKTCAVPMQFHIQDYVLCFVAIVLVIIAFVLL